MKNIRTQNVIRAVKQALAERGLTYKDLAYRMGMSESGIKKVMGGQDISLYRLEQICDLCEISFIEVLQSAHQDKISDVFLSFEQEQFLLRNPKIFRFYWKIRIDQMSQADFRKTYRVSITETQRWVASLEKVGLLKVGKRGQVEFTHRGLIRWNPESALVKYLNSIWGPKIVARANEKSNSASFINLAGLYLNESAAGELKKDLLEVFDRYSKISVGLKPQKAAQQIGFLAAFTTFDFDIE